jgi:hypothetical protein
MAFTSSELAERTLHRRGMEAVIWGMPAVNPKARHFRNLPPSTHY